VNENSIAFNAPREPKTRFPETDLKKSFDLRFFETIEFFFSLLLSMHAMCYKKKKKEKRDFTFPLLKRVEEKKKKE